MSYEDIEGPASSSTVRELHAELSEDLGWRFIDYGNDPRPAVRLRRELERDRRMGLAFDDVWLEDIALVTASISDTRDSAAWKRAFLWSENAWRLAYEQAVTQVCELTVDLVAA